MKEANYFSIFEADKKLLIIWIFLLREVIWLREWKLQRKSKEVKTFLWINLLTEDLQEHFKEEDDSLVLLDI